MKKYILTAIISLIFISTIFLTENDTSVIKYFPLDPSITFSSFGTEIRLQSEKDKDEYNISWSAYSQLEEPIYLRQDVSLLYSDGRLKGILSKWKENEKEIQLQSSVHGEDSSHFQSVTFHHGEIHYPDDIIKSIHEMSTDELYVIDSPHSPLESFKNPSDTNQMEWKKTLDHATSQQLSYHWKQLINHFQIPVNEYIFVPLTDLPKYERNPIPNLNQEETKRVISQLWEGLYKNYILNISERNKSVNSFVPLILFDRNGKHLIVLYQDENNEKQQLIQHYSFDNR